MINLFGEILFKKTSKSLVIFSSKEIKHFLKKKNQIGVLNSRNWKNFYKERYQEEKRKRFKFQEIEDNYQPRFQNPPAFYPQHPETNSSHFFGGDYDRLPNFGPSNPRFFFEKKFFLSFKF